MAQRDLLWMGQHWVVPNPKLHPLDHALSSFFFFFLLSSQTNPSSSLGFFVVVVVAPL